MATITTTEDFHANMVFHQIQCAKFVQFFSLSFFRVPCGGRDGQVHGVFVLFFLCLQFFILGSGCLFFVYYFLLHVTGENSFFSSLDPIFSLRVRSREGV